MPFQLDMEIKKIKTLPSSESERFSFLLVAEQEYMYGARGLSLLIVGAKLPSDSFGPKIVFPRFCHTPNRIPKWYLLDYQGFP